MFVLEPFIGVVRAYSWLCSGIKLGLAALRQAPFLIICLVTQRIPYVILFEKNITSNIF